MPGELWREQVQIGKETTYGTAVAATRKAYLRDVSLTREREPRVHRFATGTPDNVRAQTLGPIMAGGSVSLPVSADELVEFFQCGIRGAVTPTTPAGFTNGRLWTFTPGGTLDSMTIERNDGAAIKRARGVYVDSFTFAGSVNGENTVTMPLFGKDYEALGALTGALPERVPTFIEGWEAALYIDAIGGTPGTTRISNTMINWNVVIGNNLGRKYFADNTLATGAVTRGMLDVTATLMFEAVAGQAATEFTNWEAETGRLVRLEFGQNEVIDVGTNELQTVTITGTPTGGTFTITFRNATSSAIPYNATAAAMQAILEAMPTIGSGNVTVGGGPGPATALTMTFVGQLSGLNLPQATAAHAFTGGTTPNLSVATTTPGVGSKRALFIDIPGFWSAYSLNNDDEGTRTYELSIQYSYDAVNAFGLQIGCINNRTVAFA